MQNQRRIKLKLSARAFRDDPWNQFGSLRQQGPVIPVQMPLLGKCWAATTYQAVNDSLKDTVHFARNPGSAGRNSFFRFQWVMPRSLMTLANNMLAADGQDHRRLRSLVDQAFARRNIDDMSDQIREAAEQQLDFAASVLQSGQVDLVEHFAKPLALTVICDLLGLPKADQPKFKAWFAPLTNASSFWSLLSITGGIRKLIRYLTALFEEVRRNPREGLISELVQAEHEGQRLTESELLSMVFLLLVAGHETTVHLIINSVYVLLSEQGPRNQLMKDGSLMDSFIEEVLRFASPIQIAKPRYVVEDYVFHGTELKRGEMLVPLLASANYDPAQFADPDQFLIRRQPNYHMTFGSGPHVCLGMKLARCETQHAIRALIDRWPHLQAAFDLSQPDWTRRIGVRGMKSCPIHVSE